MNNIEWYNQNSGRAFPLAEDCSRQADDGFILPDSLIVDLSCVVPSLAGSVFHLAEISLTGTLLRGVIANGADIIATFTAELAVISRYTRVTLVGTPGSYDDLQGVVVLGDPLLYRMEMLAGRHVFNYTTAAIEPRAIRPALRAVRSLQVSDSRGALSAVLHGNVRLIPGRNIRLTPVPATVAVQTDPITGAQVSVVTAGPGIRIDATTDRNYSDPCECDNALDLGGPILSINGVTPDSAGNIDLVPTSSCLQITPGGPAVVELNDTCTKPCCGCSELNAVTDGARNANMSVSNLGRAIATLEATINAFKAEVLAVIR